MSSYKDGGHSASDDTFYTGIDALPSHSSSQEAKCQQHDGKQTHNDAEYHENNLYVQQPDNSYTALYYFIYYHRESEMKTEILEVRRSNIKVTEGQSCI